MDMKDFTAKGTAQKMNTVPFAKTGIFRNDRHGELSIDLAILL